MPCASQSDGNGRWPSCRIWRTGNENRLAFLTYSLHFKCYFWICIIGPHWIFKSCHNKFVHFCPISCISLCIFIMHKEWELKTNNDIQSSLSVQVMHFYSYCRSVTELFFFPQATIEYFLSQLPVQSLKSDCLHFKYEVTSQSELLY